MRRRNCWAKTIFDMPSERPEPGILDCMPELKSAIDTAKEIKQLKATFLKMTEDLRLKIGAFSVNVEIETDCDHENRCEITINIA